MVTHAPVQETFPRLLFERAARTPKRVAIREKRLGIWEETTWAMYAQAVTHFALGLYSMGVRRGERVALMADNSARWLIADLAIQSLGAVTVGIYPSLSDEALAHTLQDSDAAFFVGGDQEYLDRCADLLDQLPAMRQLVGLGQSGALHSDSAQVAFWDEVMKAGQGLAVSQPQLFETLLRNLGPTDLCTIAYTSGTTGAPKGVRLSHADLVAAVDGLIAANPLHETDSLVSCLPLCHSTERVFSGLAPLRAGYVVCFPENLGAVNDALFDIAPTLLLGTPRMYERWASQAVIRNGDADWLKQRAFRWALSVGQQSAELQLGKKAVPGSLKMKQLMASPLICRPVREKLGLRRIRLAYVEGEPASPQSLSFFGALGVPVLAAYGSAEMGGISFCQRLGDQQSGTVGKPLSGLEYSIAKSGELLLRRPGGEWITTGDVATVDPQGHISIVGRLADVYRDETGTLRSPAEVESRLKASPYIRQVVVVHDEQGANNALIEVDPLTCGDYAKRKGITFTTFRTLVEHPEIQKLVDDEVSSINHAMAPHQRVHAFALLPKEFDEEDDLITATGKVKRQNVVGLYGSLLDALKMGVSV